MAGGLCSRCEKLLDGAHTTYCKACNAEYQREWRKNNRKKAREISRKGNKKLTPERRRAYKLKNMYGLTMEKFESLLQDQENACAICLEEFDSSPAVDHNHETGEVRGLLCHQCNFALGNVRDNPVLALRVADYLIQHGSVVIPTGGETEWTPSELK